MDPVLRSWVVLPARQRGTAGTPISRAKVALRQHPSASPLGILSTHRHDTSAKDWSESMTSLHLGDTAPDFTAPTTEGKVSFLDWKGDNWAVFFSHPADYTPVCTTELGPIPLS